MRRGYRKETYGDSDVPSVSAPAEVMTIKHLMAEHSGLGYDIWGHLDQKVLSAFV